MNKFKLTRAEKAVEAAVLRGEYRDVSPEKFQAIAAAFTRARKDAVISIRLNSNDLAGIKKKAKERGIPYQTFIAEIIHHYATQ